MDLADRIIEHGTFVAGGTIPTWLQPPMAADFNTLRNELIAARQARENRQRFEVYGDMNADGSWLTISCDRCTWYADVEDPLTLAELNQRADEHTEVCR